MEDDSQTETTSTPYTTITITKQHLGPNTQVHLMFWNTFCVLNYTSYSEIHFVFWTTPHVLKYILCSEVHLMFWNTFCVLNYTSCSEIHFVFWITPHVLKHILCSELHIMFWNTFIFCNALYVLKFLECSRILNYFNQIYSTYRRI